MDGPRFRQARTREAGRDDAAVLYLPGIQLLDGEPFFLAKIRNEFLFCAISSAANPLDCGEPAVFPLVKAFRRIFVRAIALSRKNRDERPAAEGTRARREAGTLPLQALFLHAFLVGVVDARIVLASRALLVAAPGRIVISHGFYNSAFSAAALTIRHALASSDESGRV